MKNDDNIIGWFSLDNGTHVPLTKGESKKEATSKFLGNKMSRVKKNKEKYDTISKFKKKKESNKLKDDEVKYNVSKDGDKYELDDKSKEKVMRKMNRQNDENVMDRFDVSDDGTKYTMKTDLRKELHKEYRLPEFKGYQENEKEEFYEKLGKWHAVDSAGHHRADREYLYDLPNDSELHQEIYDKLDPIVERGETPTKEQVKEVIENYRKRKLSSKTPRDTSPSKNEMESLHKEYDYLTKEMQRLASGRQFWVRDNPSNKDNYLMGFKDFMSPEEHKDYDKVARQREEIHRRIAKLRDRD